MAKVSIVAFLLTYISVVFGKYAPNWSSLDSRPLPQWYDDAKVGIFIHWGVFSVPSFGSEWFWINWAQNDTDYVNYVDKYYPKNFLYPDFAKDFTAEFYNATEWAEIFANSGAKYVVLTSKHHEGYTMWPSKYSFNWNSKDVGSGRDLLGELAEAVRGQNLTFGVYHSLFEWFNLLYRSDKLHLFLTQEFVRNKVIPEMVELIETYKPAVIWSDGDWEAPDFYWNSTAFLAWLYNESPVKDFVVSNDRWGAGIPCHHGDFYTCQDRYSPGVLQKHKWENAMTIDKRSWGFRRNAKLEDFLTPIELLTELAKTVSCGGNILINIGPTKDGIITPIFQERLKSLGEWLKINGEAIYSSKPWSVQNDTLTTGVWYTMRDKAVYAIVLFWPEGNTLELASALPLFKEGKTQVSLLGAKGTLSWVFGKNTDRIVVTFPDKSTVTSKDAYVLKIERLSYVLKV